MNIIIYIYIYIERERDIIGSFLVPSGRPSLVCTHESAGAGSRSTQTTEDRGISEEGGRTSGTLYVYMYIYIYI